MEAGFGLTCSFHVCRYAETQTCDNGARYRDWVCMLYDRETMAVHKARLEGHVVHGISETYQTEALPWAGGNGQYYIVSTCSPSSIPFPLDLLPLIASPPVLAGDQAVAVDTSFGCFARAVRAHVAHNLVPPGSQQQARGASFMGSHKREGTVYHDAEGKTVTFVYPVSGMTRMGVDSAAPPPPPRLEVLQYCFVV